VVHTHRHGVDTVAVQPGPVVREVLPDRADQQRLQAEHTHPEGDVRGHSPAPYIQILDEERDRQMGELVGQQLLGEPTRVGHQVVGGDGSGDRDAHGATR
jgi:hypothetical protein